LLGIALAAASLWAAAHLPKALALLETDLPPELYAGYLPWLTAGGTVLAAAGIASASLRGRRTAAALTLALGGLAWVQIVLSGRVRHVQRERPCRFSEGAPGRGPDRRERLAPGDREKTVNAASWALILTGVLLNAAAQLLLKAGTNAVGQFEFSAQNIVPVGIKLAFEPHIAGGVA